MNLKKMMGVSLFLTLFIVSCCFNYNSNVVVKTFTKYVALNEQNSMVDLRIKSIEMTSNDKKIDFDFNPEIKKYTIALPDSTMNKLAIKANLMDSRAHFQFELLESNYFLLKYGKNVITLVVSSDGTDEKIPYTFEIIRPSGLAAESRLSYLKVNDKEVKLSNELEYLVVLNDDVSRTKIETRVDTKGIRVEYNDIDLKDGANQMIISLVDDDNVRLDYVITILKLVDDKYSKFESINIEGVNFDFDINKYDYDIFVDNIKSNYDITVNPNSIYFSTKVVYDEDVESVLTIKIFDDCETKTYTFHLIPKKEINEDSTKNDIVKKNEEEKTNNYSVYYIFFIISTIILIISICYSIIVKKKKAKKILSIE